MVFPTPISPNVSFQTPTNYSKKKKFFLTLEKKKKENNKKLNQKVVQLILHWCSNYVDFTD